MLHEEAVSEFLEETWEMLDGLSAVCDGGKTPWVFRESLGTLERNLHTIKGNAAVFGFDDLSGAASRALDWLRSAQLCAGKALEKPEDIPPVVAFTGKLRQYLTLLRRGDHPPRDLLLEASSPAPPAADAVENETRGGPPAPLTALPGADHDWEEEARKILAEAPLVTPRIDSIVWTAIQKLTGGGDHESPARPAEHGPDKPPEAPAPPSADPVPPLVEPARASEEVASLRKDPAAASGCADGPTEAVSHHGPTLHAYAFEAMAKAEWLRRLREKCDGSGWLEAAFSEVSDVLDSFARWSVEARSQPLSSFLAEPLGWARRKAVSVGSTLEVEVAGGDVLVLPPAGRLIESLLNEVLRAALAPSAPAPSSQAPAPRLEARIESARAGGLLKVTVSKLRGLDRATAKLQLDLLRRRVERGGVSVAREAGAGGESGIAISVPDRLDGMEVLIVRAGDDRIGLPMHRVHAALDPGGVEGHVRCQGGWLEAQGERLPVLDLAAEDVAGGSRGGVVIVRTDKGKRVLRVDEILRREEMVVTGPEHDALPGEAFGLCLAPRSLEWMPFLWCSSRYFEHEESLVPRL